MTVGQYVLNFEGMNDGNVAATLTDVTTRVRYTVTIHECSLCGEFNRDGIDSREIYEHLVSFVRPHSKAHNAAIRESIRTSTARMVCVGGPMDGTEMTIHLTPESNGMPDQVWESEDVSYFRDPCTGLDGVWRYRTGELTGQTISQPKAES